jgi:hypothetical protein
VEIRCSGCAAVVDIEEMGRVIGERLVTVGIILASELDRYVLQPVQKGSKVFDP